MHCKLSVSIFPPQDVWIECPTIQGGGADAKCRLLRALAVDSEPDVDGIDGHIKVGRDHVTRPEGGAITVK